MLFQVYLSVNHLFPYKICQIFVKFGKDNFSKNKLLSLFSKKNKLDTVNARFVDIDGIRHIRCLDKRQRIPKGQSKMDNPDEDKQNKNTTKYVLDTAMRKQTQIT